MKIKTTTFSILTLTFALMIFSYNYSLADNQEKEANSEDIYYNDKLFVKFKQPKLTADIYFLYSNSGFSIYNVENVFDQPHAPLDFKDQVFEIEIGNPANLEKAIQAFSQQQDVIYAEKIPKLYLLATPNDPMFNQLWGMKKIKAPKAWDINQGSKNIIVGVSDTGVDINHEDLKANLLEGKNFVGSGPPVDTFGHGTHVAGTIAAVGNNNKGVIGVCPECSIMPLKIGNKTVVDTSAAIQSITYAADNGASIINMSWGGVGNSQTLHDAIKYAHGKDVVLVAAAGNGARDACRLIPASFSETIAVAATNSSDQRASFSNYGSCVDVAAPGVGILSSELNNSYKVHSGTSMASPHVAGLAALIRSVNPDLSNEKVREVIKQTADKINTDKPVGAGRINAYKAVSTTRPPQPGAPVAKIEANPTSGKKPLKVMFLGEKSHDPDGNIIRYSWDFGDGSAKYSGKYLVKVAHVYTEKGTYTATLTVTDDEGNKDSDSIKIEAGTKKWKEATIYGTVTGKFRRGRRGVIDVPGRGGLMPGIKVSAKALGKDAGDVTTDSQGKYSLKVKVRGNGSKFRVTARDPRGLYETASKETPHKVKPGERVQVDIEMVACIEPPSPPQPPETPETPEPPSPEPPPEPPSPEPPSPEPPPEPPHI